MSNEIELIKDPGLPAHVHRQADIDPVAAARAERQVAILLSFQLLELFFLSSLTFLSQMRLSSLSLS